MLDCHAGSVATAGRMRSKIPQHQDLMWPAVPTTRKPAASKLDSVRVLEEARRSYAALKRRLSA